MNGDNKIIYASIGELHGKVDRLLDTQKAHSKKLDKIVPDIAELKVKASNAMFIATDRETRTRIRLGRLEKGLLIVFAVLIASGLLSAGSLISFA